MAIQSPISSNYTNLKKIPLSKNKKEENNPEFQGYLKDHLSLDEKKLINTQAGYIASQFDVQAHPKIFARNILTAAGIIAILSNISKYMMSGNLNSDLDDSVTIGEVIKNTPLYKIGQKMNENAPVLNKIAEDLTKQTSVLNKDILKNKTLRQISDCYKDGTKVTWSMGRLYEEGRKGFEAFDDMIMHLQVAKFKDKKVQSQINNILSQVKIENLTNAQAAEKIIKSGILENVSANELKNISANPSNGINKIANKIFGVENNLAHSYTRAKFFNGQNKDLGKVPNFFSKTYLIISDTIGGGSFGGGLLAITMGIFGFITAINAMTKASIAKKEKNKRIKEELELGSITKEEAQKMKKQPWCGEKFSAFMEDLFGFTVGSCLVLYPLGRIINKSMGLSNLGRDTKAIQKAAKELGVNGSDKIYQRTILKYNQNLKDSKTAEECKRMLNDNFTFSEKIKTIFGKNPLAQNINKLNLNLPENATCEDLKKIIENKIIPSKTAKAQREMLKQAGKSQLTIESIFKANEWNDGKTTISRLTRYMIQKPLEIGAKILGPDKYLMYRPNTGIGNKLYNAGAKIIDIGGGVGRVALVGFGLSSACRKVLMKISHLIFGKPTFSQADETEGKYNPQKIEEAKIALESLKNPNFTIPESYQKSYQIQNTNPLYQDNEEELISSQTTNFQEPELEIINSKSISDTHHKEEFIDSKN